MRRWSTASEIRLRMPLARILLGTDRRVTPLQLLQLLCFRGEWPFLFTHNRRVGGSAVLEADELCDLVDLSLLSPAGGLFCFTCHVFHAGLIVCPCHPLHCLVCLSILLPASLSLSDLLSMTIFRALLLSMCRQVSAVIHSFLVFFCLRPRLSSSFVCVPGCLRWSVYSLL